MVRISEDIKASKLTNPDPQFVFSVDFEGRLKHVFYQSQ